MSDLEEFVIYAIKNVENGKVYVGSTTDFEKRKREHIFHLNRGTHHTEHLQRAWTVYGEESFLFRALCREVGTREERWAREQDFITALKADQWAFGYNASPSAGATRGFKMPEAAKRKISRALRGRPKSEEHRRKLSMSNGSDFTTRLYEAFGRSQLLLDWAKEFGMHVETLKMRLRRGYNLETALTKPLRLRRAV